MSNLSILASRCPVMGKAMASRGPMAPGSSFRNQYGSIRSFGEYSGKARLHTSGLQAATVDSALIRNDRNGMNNAFCS